MSNIMASSSNVLVSLIILCMVSHLVACLDATPSSTVTSDPGTKVGTHSTGECALFPLKQSTDYFTSKILLGKYNFVYLQLSFDVQVGETNSTILSDRWVWTYDGDGGARQYLNLPGDFGYLSLGLLWVHTLKDKYIYVNMTHSGQCKGLRVGSKRTDMLIGLAMSNLTSKLAAKDDLYNSSFWCYNKRYYIKSSIIFYLCKNAICPMQTFEYRCCKYFVDFNTQERTVVCQIDDFVFGVLWWLLPIIFGEIAWSFYPLLLTKLGIAINKVSRRCVHEQRYEEQMCLLSPTATNWDHTEESYVRLDHSFPITFISAICSPFKNCNVDNPFLSRGLRVLIILLPMSLSTARVLLDNWFAHELVVAAVQKHALVGFSSIIAGPALASENFLYIFAGPYVALSIFVCFGILLISFPTDLEAVLQNGLFMHRGRNWLMVKTPIKKMEQFSRISVRHCYGYKKIHRYFLAQMFMLLNRKFWMETYLMFNNRYRHILFGNLKAYFGSMNTAITISIALFPVYIVFCAVEIVLSTTYFAFPVVNCMFVLIKSFTLAFFNIFYARHVLLRAVRCILMIPLLALFCITWYMYCIIFFDGFWWLSKISMFTYSGIIAYPKLSYGYLILVFMAVYYLLENSLAFGKNYRELLKVSIKACQSIEPRYSQNAVYRRIFHRNGIRQDLFDTIVEHHRPCRNQVIITVFKFVCIVAILTISIDLIITFDKFEDVSLEVQVFTVLFICALPKIIHVLCLKRNRANLRRRLRKEICLTVEQYIRRAH